MKKPRLQILVTVTFVFAAFTLGFLLGRNNQHGGITLAIPAVMETMPRPVAEAAETKEDHPISFPIDLNTAGCEELTALPGIGEVLAKRILAYREEHGPFGAVEELMLVEGIGEKKIEQILDKITIGG